MFLLNSQIPLESPSSPEPILLPKLQIHLADFPYQRSPETRGSSPWRPVAVSGTGMAPPIPLRRDLACTRRQSAPHARSFLSQRSRAARASGRTLLLLRARPPLQKCRAVAAQRHGLGLSTQFPFGCVPAPLGPGSPSPDRPQEEPFSPVLKIPARVVLLPPRSALQAPPHAAAPVLPRHPHAPLLRAKERRVAGLGAGLQRHPFSRPPSSAGTLQHVSYQMPASMATALLSILGHTLRSLTPLRRLIQPVRFFPLRQPCLPEPAH